MHVLLHNLLDIIRNPVILHQPIDGPQVCDFGGFRLSELDQQRLDFIQPVSQQHNTEELDEGDDDDLFYALRRDVAETHSHHDRHRPVERVNVGVYPAVLVAGEVQAVHPVRVLVFSHHYD